MNGIVLMFIATAWLRKISTLLKLYLSVNLLNKSLYFAKFVFSTYTELFVPTIFA